MEYTKPMVITAEKVNAAKCGDGPCGRPCSTNRAQKLRHVDKKGAE